MRQFVLATEIKKRLVTLSNFLVSAAMTSIIAFLSKQDHLRDYSPTSELVLWSVIMPTWSLKMARFWQTKLQMLCFFFPYELKSSSVSGGIFRGRISLGFFNQSTVSGAGVPQPGQLSNVVGHMTGYFNDYHLIVVFLFKKAFNRKDTQGEL